MNQNSKTLLTGATGFIGSHLAQSLIAKGKRVSCLVRKSSPEAAMSYLSSLGAELVYGDLTDRESLGKAVSGVDTVFHLGGGGRANMPEDTLRQINVEGTRNILDACLQRGGVKRFVHISTCGVMGNIENPPADETYPRNPANVSYSIAKADAEKVALSYKDNLSMVVVRFPLVYGPLLITGEIDQIEGVTPMSMIFSMVKKGAWVYLGNRKTLIHCVHVEDVVRGVELAAERGKAGETYILADEQAVTMETMIGTVARSLNVDAPRRQIPVLAAQTLALLFESGAKLFGGAPRISSEMVRASLVNRAFDISKARRELGYEPKFSLAEGIETTVKWYEQKGYV